MKKQTWYHLLSTSTPNTSKISLMESSCTLKKQKKKRRLKKFGFQHLIPTTKKRYLMWKFPIKEKVRNILTKKLYTPYLHQNGYLSVCVNGGRIYIHRLVAATHHVDKYRKGYVVDHLNRKRICSWASNLE